MNIYHELQQLKSKLKKEYEEDRRSENRFLAGRTAGLHFALEELNQFEKKLYEITTLPFVPTSPGTYLRVMPDGSEITTEVIYLDEGGIVLGFKDGHTHQFVDKTIWKKIQ
jgi:hypothetical protein